MLGLTLILDGDNAWPDLKDKQKAGKLVWLNDAHPAPQITALAGGMMSGKTSIAIRIDLPDGTTVVQETSLTLFLAAADAFRAKYPQ